MTASKRLLLVALTFCVATAWGQNANEPHIAYLYPGGGQQGDVFHVVAGGQFIRAAKKVHVSGEGVTAKFVKAFRPVRNLQKDQREHLQWRMRQVRDARLAELPPKARAALTARGGPGNWGNPKGSLKKKPKDPLRPYDHPALYNLEEQSLRELAHTTYEIFFPRAKKQMNAQLAEMVMIEVTIDPDAAPGDRELRLESATGLTNPMVFQVGQLPETRELEPNDPKPYVNPNAPQIPPIELPAILNGQIMPGDVDRFRIRAKQGQQLVMEVSARRLIPYLADAVPGWFQATVALYDPKGNEVAFADDYRFNPDPVLFYRIPTDGIYELEIRDSIYRGREDFVYRVAVGELPFITEMFPLGGPEGVKTVASVDGWNLTKTNLPLDTQPGDCSIRQTTLRQNKRISNEVTYAVGCLPECLETEPNNTIKHAQLIELPRVVNGRIAEAGDVDVFKFKGRSGDKVVGEVFSRRLKSPLDSLLRLTDASGRVLEWNDDYDEKDGHLRMGAGLLTHHADSYMTARLPKDGTYYLHLADTQNHGGSAYGYRLHITPSQGDFALRLNPSSLSIPAGSLAPVTVHVLRKSGFEGEIELSLVDAPVGFELSGGRIPEGQDCVRMTLKAPQRPPAQPVALKLEGRAEIDGKTVTRPVVPVEDMMQAFLWRHLAPSQELAVSVRKAQYRGPVADMAAAGPVKIPEGGTAELWVKTPKLPNQRKLELKLSEPPAGVTLQKVKVMPNGQSLQLKVDGEKAKAGLENNLIVEAFTEISWPKKGNRKAGKRRVSIGVLPAIPFEVVQR